MKTDDKTLIEALRILPKWLQDRGSFEGARIIVNAANRLEELTREDMVLVPREPTEAMLNVCLGKDETEYNKNFIKGCYICMIKAHEEQGK